MSSKRQVPIVVISDVHLGTPACRAEALFDYLCTVRPGMLVLAGDIIDFWHVKRGFWPASHMKVLRRLMKMASKGVPVWFVPGNHDACVREYAGFELGGVHVVDQLELEQEDGRALVVHGDFFDAVHALPRWMTWVGALGYDALMSISVWCTRLRRLVGMGPISLSTIVTRNLPGAVAHIARFRQACARLAAGRGCSTVICGHIHQPDDRVIEVDGQQIRYLNSGDWVAHCSLLEYDGHDWHLRHWLPAPSAATEELTIDPWPGRAAAVIPA